MHDPGGRWDDRADDGRTVLGTTHDGGRTAAARRLLQAHHQAGLHPLVVLATELLGTPSAEISLLTDVRVVVGAVAALPGPAGTRTSLEETLCAQVVAAGAPLVVEDATADPRVDAVRGPVAEVGAYLGVPLVDGAGQVVGAMCVYQPGPRVWTEDEVATLERLADAAVRQLEVTLLDQDLRVADRLAMLDAAAQAAGVGTFRWHLPSGDLHWDASLLDAFGYDEDSFGGTIAAFDARVHPQDLPHVTEALDTAIATVGVYEAEFRVVRPDGTVVWLAARGRALAGPSGETEQVIGVATDTTALRAHEERVQQILETMTVGYFWLGPDWRFGYVNAEAERILQRPRAELVGGDIWHLFPAAVGTNFEESYRTVARTGRPLVFDAYYPAPLDAWFEVRAVAERGGVSVYFTDITERRQALALAEQARTRADMLAAVAGTLVDTLDPLQALQGVLPHVVPALADYAIASLLDDGSAGWRERLHDVAALHADPDQQPTLDAYRAARAAALTDESLVARVLARGTQAMRTGLPAPGEVVVPGTAQDLRDALAPASVVVLPLRGRGRVRGLLTLVRGAGREPFTPADHTVLRTLKTQVALALDNAQLHAARRALAEELQDSLLTDLPEPEHLQLVARYVPAATTARIGGDWYDAFVVRDGTTCLVIGDVTGHDLRAAVEMAQLRNVLRGGAHAVVQPPAAILSSFDWAVHDLGIGATCTGVLAKVEQPSDLAARGRHRLRWSNAGHPPPLLVRADGQVELLRRPADLLLGMRRDTVRRDHTVDLTPGSTVLLYTDGLVERRGESLAVGLERLRTTVEGIAHLPLDELCDRLVADLAADSLDDVALLAVRTRPEDVRPAEAAPPRTGRTAGECAAAHAPQHDG